MRTFPQALLVFVTAAGLHATASADPPAKYLKKLGIDDLKRYRREHAPPGK